MSGTVSRSNDPRHTLAGVSIGERRESVSRVTVVPMALGEAIPMWFLEKAGALSGSAGGGQSKVLILWRTLQFFTAFPLHFHCLFLDLSLPFRC